jgi:5-methylcytosine-specific restriction protein A
VARYPERARFYKSGGWKAARERHLRANPTCTVCGARATIVDHVVNRAEGGPGLDPRNLQSLCDVHHRQKTTAEGHRGMKRKANR